MFKVLFHLKSRYYRKTGFFSGVKQFWCIDSHKDVVDTLNKLNDKKEAKTISTYDFSTLYTNIPHNKLIEVLSEIVLTSFNTDTRKVLSVGKKRAYWVKGFSTSRFHFSAEDIIACMEFLIGNAYFRVGNSIFRQKKLVFPWVPTQHLSLQICSSTATNPNGLNPLAITIYN